MGDPPTSICGFRVFKLNAVIYGEEENFILMDYH